jgi:hypothetical protein
VHAYGVNNGNNAGYKIQIGGELIPLHGERSKYKQYAYDEIELRDSLVISRWYVHESPLAPP